MTLQTPTQAHQDGFRLDYTPGSAVVAGAVVDLGKGLIGFTDEAIAASRLGAVAIRGVRRAKKATTGVTFAVGDEVIWDVTNGTAVALATGLTGDVYLYLGICVYAAAESQDHVCFLAYPERDRNANVQQAFVYEFDFETTAGTGTGVKTLIPASMNRHGLIYWNAFAVVTEVFGGASQDQGILTLKDTAGTPNTLGTITAADAGADAIGDILVATNVGIKASSGAALLTVAAGLGITGTITQQTSGAGEAGKFKVYLEMIPLL